MLDLNEGEQEINSKFHQRIKKLSETIELTKQERDELKASIEKLNEEKTLTQKERDFFASFADSTAKYPNAHEYKDSIKEKVMAGYTVEDATVAVLAKEGKLNVATPPSESPAGGSASNPPPSDGVKTLSEMTKEEKRQALMEAESKGDFSFS